MDVISANQCLRNHTQEKSAPDWIVIGWRKWRFTSWFESVYPLAAQGYSFERRGPYLVGIYTDAQEGRS